MIQFDSIGREYVRLALHVEQHFRGFVDAYYGPPEIKARVEAEGRRDVHRLRDEVEALSGQIAAAVLDDRRRDYLLRQLRAMQTVLRRLAGEELALVEEVQGCFDITPERVDDATLEAVRREIDALLPGAGDLTERLTAWRRQLELPVDRILPVAQLALAEARQRSAALFDLPEGESVDLQLVSDKPWSAYNWYLGNYRSRIDINTDTPIYADTVWKLITHEVYPGHHTEHMLKERRWYRQAGRLEHSIQLLIAPESFVAEAIATTAADVIWPDRVELAQWLNDVVFPAANIQVGADQALRIGALIEALADASDNAAFMLHADRRPPEEVLDYLRHYSLRRESELQRTLRFVSDPQFRTYVFNYRGGSRLLKHAGEVVGLREAFRWVSTEPVTPSAIMAACYH